MTTLQRLCILTILCFSTMIHATDAPAPPPHNNRIVAIVGNSVITQHQLNLAMHEAQTLLQQQKRPLPNDPELHHIILSQLINNRVQSQLAQSNHIHASDKETQAFIDQIAKQNHQHIKDIMDLLYQSGYTKKEAMQKMQEQLIIHETEEMAINPKINVLDTQVQQLQKQYANEQPEASYHLTDLRITLPEQAKPEARQATQKKAEALRSQAMSQHISLQEIAAKNAHDSTMSFQDLGVRQASDIPGIFHDSLTLDSGAISLPIMASNGYHLLQMVGRKRPMALSKQQAYQILYQRQFSEQLQRWLNELRDQTYVEIKPDV